MNRLKGYVRRTITKAATEYAYPKERRTAESMRSACMDATRGTDTGWWTELIYTEDVLNKFNRHRKDVAAAIREYLYETGVPASQRVMRDCETTFADMLASTSGRYTFADYDDETSDAFHAAIALRFAVEYLAGEVCRDLCPDL